MAIRLYPNCSSEQLEKLANVPQGTHARLMELKKEQPTNAGPTMDAWYNKLYQDNHLITLNNFIVFGWGRLTTEATEYKNRVFPQSEFAGYTEDPELAQGFIRAMGITAEGITSVRWS